MNRNDTLVVQEEMRMLRICLAVLIVTVFTLSSSFAQGFPDRTVRILVGFAPGGSDIGGRIVAQKLSTMWGQPVVVDNRPGASGNIAADLVAKSAPDGYTILLYVNSYAINTTVYRNLGWDLLRDFAPVGRYAAVPMVLVVDSKLPLKTVPELIAYGKENRGKLNYSSAGSGTANHLAAELFASGAGLEMTHVPYKGGAPSVVAVIQGEVQLSIGALTSFDAQIKSGRVRPLAVTTAARSPLLPDVPTIAESGIPGFDADIWYGFAVPVKTPPEVVRKLSDDLGRAMADPEIQKMLVDRGIGPAYLNSQQMGELVKREVAMWRDTANRIKLSLEGTRRKPTPRRQAAARSPGLPCWT